MKENEIDMAIIEAEEMMENHYRELDNLLEEFSETDRAFMLWILLQDYIDDCEKEDNEYYDSNTDVSRYALHEMLRTHKLVAEQMRNILYYKWS